MYRLLRLIFDTESIALEVSAAAGLDGPSRIESGSPGAGHHVIWATGGGQLPEAVFQEMYMEGSST